MRKYKDSTFSNTDVNIDNNMYENCLFENCQMIYRGSNIVSFNKCNFNKCTWIFEDNASNTLNFLKSLYQGLGDDGRLVESIFASIRESNTE